MTSENKLTSSQLLVQYLKSLGPIRKPKLKDAPKGTKAKGLLVYNPKPYDLQKLEQLATTVNESFVVIPKPQGSLFEGRQIPPSIFIGITTDLTEDEAVDHFDSL